MAETPLDKPVGEPSPDSPGELSGNLVGHGPAASQEAGKESEQPRGTLFLMILFLILIVGFWTYVYLLMLERS